MFFFVILFLTATHHERWKLHSFCMRLNNSSPFLVATPLIAIYSRDIFRGWLWIGRNKDISTSCEMSFWWNGLLKYEFQVIPLMYTWRNSRTSQLLNKSSKQVASIARERQKKNAENVIKLHSKFAFDWIVGPFQLYLCHALSFN